MSQNLSSFPYHQDQGNIDFQSTGNRAFSVQGVNMGSDTAHSSLLTDHISLSVGWVGGCQSHNISIAPSSFPLKNEYSIMAGYSSKRLKKHKNLSYEIGLGFMRKGGSVRELAMVYDASGNPYAIYNYYEGEALSYLFSNFSMKEYFAPAFYAKAGLSLGFITGYSETIQPISSSASNSDYTDPNLKNAYYKVTAGFSYGLGYELNLKRGGLVFEALVLDDFTPAGLKTALPTSYYNNCFVVSVGYFLALSH